LATIRDKGLCPCPRCSVPKAQFDNLGWVKDSEKRVKEERSTNSLVANARNHIYNKGFSLTSAAIERMLKPTSLVPTIVCALSFVRPVIDPPPPKNAFTSKLGLFGFNPYRMLTVDFMHEFELGVWKTTFIHIIRVLYVAIPQAGVETIAKLNAR
jgi:hypothetical protein